MSRAVTKRRWTSRHTMRSNRTARAGAWSIVIHCGAVTNKFNQDADRVTASNIIGTANVVLWCSRHKARLVYVSSITSTPGEGRVFGTVSAPACQPVRGVQAWRRMLRRLARRQPHCAHFILQRTELSQRVAPTSILPVCPSARRRKPSTAGLRDDVSGVINVGSRRPVDIRHRQE